MSNTPVLMSLACLWFKLQSLAVLQGDNVKHSRKKKYKRSHRQFSGFSQLSQSQLSLVSAAMLGQLQATGCLIQLQLSPNISQVASANAQNTSMYTTHLSLLQAHTHTLLPIIVSLFVHHIELIHLLIHDLPYGQLVPITRVWPCRAMTRNHMHSQLFPTTVNALFVFLSETGQPRVHYGIFRPLRPSFRDDDTI